MINKKIIAAGHICLDITPVFPMEKTGNLADIFSPGKLVCMDGVEINTGGSVANTGIAMKLLGADVSLMGKIGKDAFGNIICSILEKFDAMEHMIVDKESSTSYSIVIAPKGVDRIFLHNPGANNTYSVEDLDFTAIRDAALVHFGYPTVMKKLYEKDGEQLVRMFRSIKECNVATSLDMAAMDADSEAGHADWIKILGKVIPYVDFFMPSIEELAFMIDRPKYEELLERADGKDITGILSIERDVKPLADRLMEMGAKVVIIKCGAPGIYYQIANLETLEKIGNGLQCNFDEWAGKSGFEESYEPERILSGTGAGDTCIAAFLTAMINGYSLETCLQLATATGACCVATYDSLSGIKSFEVLLEKIHRGWNKQHLLS